MIGKKFINAVVNSKIDLLQVLLDILEETASQYCVIGGLAVNAYVEPVVSLDLDIVVAEENIYKVCRAAEVKGLKVERFEHSINLTSTESDLRVQLQTDVRYQEFIIRSKPKEILGYRMNVAALKDILSGKTWAYADETRRKSKRQKDLADIMRLVEAYPTLETSLPTSIRKDLE